MKMSQTQTVVLNDWMLIVRGLIDDAFNILDFMSLNGVIGEYNEWERIWKEQSWSN